MVSSSSGIRALSFDCYGTLIDWERGIASALAGLGEPGWVLDRFAEHEPAVQAAKPTARYPAILAEVYRRIADDAGMAPDDADARAFGASVGDWPAFPDTAAALARLKRRFRLYILSNVDNASIARTQALLGVRFDGVFTAQDIGSYKPDLANFRYMLARLARDGIAPGDLMHVAQSLYHDHAPARALGLATCWIDRPPAFGAPAARLPGDIAAPGLRFDRLAGFADHMCG